jgi:hypothetical protein
MHVHLSGLRFLPIALLLLCFCSKREHDNPFDPLNTGTAGKPAGLSVSQQEKAVHLNWPVWPMQDIDSVIVYRRAAHETQFRSVSAVRATLHEYQDRTIVYGVCYEYYIRVRCDAYETPASDVVSITPGPTLIWVADRISGYISCLSHDLSQKFCSFGLLNFPWLLATSPKEKAVWIYSRYTDDIYKIDRSAQLRTTISGMSDVIDMQVDTTTMNLWVIAGTPAHVYKLSANGSRLLTIMQTGSPTALAIDDLHQQLFVIDDAFGRLYCYTLDGVWLATFEGLIAPKALAVDARAMKLWIADSTRLIKFDYNLMKADVQLDSLYHASCVAYDQKRQQGWLVDLNPMGKPALLIKFDAQAKPLARLERFGHPHCLAVNAFNGSCLLGDVSYLYGGLYVIADDGLSFSRFEQWLPYDIDTDYIY